MAAPIVEINSLAIPVGGEFQVNTTTDYGATPAVATLANGGFVVTWRSLGDVAFDIHAQIYGADGAVLGGEFRVNTTASFPPPGQGAPVVTALADGGFLVAWSGSNIYAQRYDANGTPADGEFQVNTPSDMSPIAPTVTGLADGGFLVSWSAYHMDGSAWDIHAQRYDAIGIPVGGEFRVNTSTGSDQVEPAVTALADGGFLVSWASTGQDGSGYDIYAQRYDAIGFPVGDEFQVNTSTVSAEWWQLTTTVTTLSDGGFLVSWASNASGATGIYAQRYDVNGIPSGGEFQVNTATPGPQEQHAVTALADGGFLVSWASTGQDGGGYDIYAKCYEANGASLGGEFRVNTTTAGGQGLPAVTALADGGFLVSWQSGDGMGEIVYAQRYAPASLITFSPDGAPVAALPQVNVLDSDSFLLSKATVALGGYQIGDLLAVNVGMPMISAHFDSDTGVLTLTGWATPDEYQTVLKTLTFATSDGSPSRTLTLTVTDESLEDSAPVSWQLAVGAGNIPPTGTATALLADAAEDTAFYLSAADLLQGFSDPDGITLGVANLRASTGSLYDYGDGTGWAYQSAHDYNGPVNLSYDVIDGRSGSIAATQSFAMIPVNDAPVVSLSEFRVNTTTVGSQSRPAVTPLADGGFLVSWFSDGLGGSGAGIYAQRYGADGTSSGGEFRVNTTTVSSNSQLAVTALADGGFLVSWHGDDNGGSGIFAQRYGADGATVGGEFQVNADPFAYLYLPTVTALADGGFLMSWTSAGGQDGSGNGIFAQRYGVDGATVGGEFQVNTTTAAEQWNSVVTTLSDGGFLVSWMSGAGGTYDIYAQRYGADGIPLGGEFQVNSSTFLNQSQPAVAALADGGFLVSWMSSGQDGLDYGYGQIIFAQRYANDGGTVGGEFQVNSGRAWHPSVTALSDGGFLVSWQSADMASGILAQRYGADGAAVGGEFQVTSPTGGAVYHPAITSLSDGSFLVSWVSDDGSGSGIYAKCYALDISSVFPDGEPVAVIQSVILSDIDSSSLSHATVGLIDYQPGDLLAVNVGTTGLSASFDSIAGLLTLTGVASPADYQTVLRTLTFATTDDSPSRTRTLSLTINDGQADSAPVYQQIAVQAVNALPTGTASAVLAHGSEDTAYTLHAVDLLQGFSDANGDTLSVINLTAATGSLTDNGDGTWTYTPAANANGLVNLAYNVSDGHGGSLAATQSFTLDAVNDAPVAGNWAISGNQGDLFAGTLPVSDVDGDPLVYVLVSPASHGTVVVNLDGSYLYTPDADFVGSDSFAFATSDGVATSNVATLSVSVYPSGALPTEGTAGNNALIGTGAADVLAGLAGNDSLQGGAGDDWLYGGTGADSLNGGAGADHLFGAEDNDALIGGSGNDLLDGGAGNDTLNGGTGDDTLQGGLGNDTYYVDAVGDAVIENADEGSDRVISSLTYVLGDNLENLTLTGTAAIDGSGNDLNNSLTGNSAANSLIGGAGNDTLNGGAGDDTLQGGLGNDAYYVDAVGDAVIENAEEGSDRVISSLTYVLGDNLENLTLSGTAAIDGSGNALNNSFTGNSAANSLFGDAGNDTLTGGGGADQLNGGIGTDRANYGASTAAVQVSLATGLGTGGEAEGDVLTSIENLTGSAWDDTLVGDAGNNSLAGNAGNDLLEGGSGNDALTGGGGADQLDGGVGTDSANYGASTAAVQVNLATGQGIGGDAEGDTLAGIENLTGSAWDDTLIGNALANYLAGNAGHDSLMGGDGNDVLNGGRGNDQLSGGAGKDIFRFTDLLDSSENLDVLLDFNSVDDTIQVARAVFDVFGQTGKLSAANFSGTGTAQDGDDYIVYNQATGSLSYDSDGNGLGAAMQFATLVSPTGLVAGDFVVI